MISFNIKHFLLTSFKKQNKNTTYLYTILIIKHFRFLDK